mmetsp:Transcript_5450/g.9125  ORF Transcript_5450/g.9125 Transcript_5450/m.9125 type:complete len:214 (+) Transcript_5450:406-1047(+)
MRLCLTVRLCIRHGQLLRVLLLLQRVESHHIRGIRNSALLQQLLHLRLTMFFPMFGVRIGDDSQRSSGINETPEGVVVAGAQNGLFVSDRRSSFFAAYKARADPHCVTAIVQRHGQSASIVDAAGTHHTHIALRIQWHLVAAHHIHAFRQQNTRRNVSCMTASLSALSANDIHSGRQRLVDVLGMTHHVHHQNACAVQTIHHFFGRHADGRDE